MPKVNKTDVLARMGWNEISDLVKGGFHPKNFEKRKHRLYYKRFVQRYNSLLKTMKALGMEQETPYLH